MGRKKEGIEGEGGEGRALRGRKSKNAPLRDLELALSLSQRGEGVQAGRGGMGALGLKEGVGCRREERNGGGGTGKVMGFGLVWGGEGRGTES